MTTYTNPFTGQTLNPSQEGYIALTISANTTLEWPINGNDTSDIAANIMDITATTTGLELIMPPATQVSVGQAVIIRNSGSNTFTVTDNSGNTIVAIPPGTGGSSINVYYIYVIDNSTTAGTWENIAMGAGTSAASASTLAGYGLVALGATLNQDYIVSTLYSNAVLNTASWANFYVWDSGAGSITLPLSSNVGNGWFVMIRNNGTGILTLTPSGSDTIDGNANQQLQISESLVIVSNGSGYNTFAYGRSNSFVYTQLLLTVTGGTLALSSAQASATIQEYVGTLTSNQIIQVPSTVQLYSFTNNTTGSYSLTFKTAAVGGATVTVAQGTSVLAICDGTNVYNATSTPISSATSLTLGVGSATAPSLNFVGNTNTGMYLPASNEIGFTLNGVSAGIMTSSGFQITVGISGGTF